MARPQKDGIDYFPFDVGFYRDKKIKLIKGEFGSQGIMVYIALLADIYGNNGYFKRWDSDDCLLVSDDVGCGCTPALIAEIVQGCVRRSLFDEGVFNMFSVLTSAGIQRRYLRAVAERSNIEMLEEYFLLDTSDLKDVPDRILGKLTLKSERLPNNEVNLPDNDDNLPDNPQSKVKESKVKESKVKDTPSAHSYGEYGWIKLMDKQYEKLLSDLGKDELERCIQYIDESAQSNGNKNKWKDWNLTIRKCSRDGWGKNWSSIKRPYHDSKLEPKGNEMERMQEIYDRVKGIR